MVNTQKWRTGAAVGAGLVTCLAGLAAAVPAEAEVSRAASAVAGQSQTVVIDGDSPGRTFEGIIAESAGASSRLLIDYPERQRSQILDYMFKPNYGASFHTLKVEIGSDTNSTTGAEPSHMRTPTEVNCNRGYEWWLMKEAKARNPQIDFIGLQWGAPGWVDPARRTAFTQANITFLISWLDCARKKGFQIDLVGGWNDHHMEDPDWFKDYRRALDKNGYRRTRIMADDTNAPQAWEVAEVMAEDPEFNDAVDVVGVHYPCGFPDGVDCPSTPTALELNKPLWASEQTNHTGSLEPHEDGADKLARMLNRVYTDGKMVATIIWPPLWSAYTGAPFPTGLLLANTPWSGHYEVGKSLWAVAHTSQFVQPGWRYLDSGSKRLAEGGSVVSLESHNGSDWSSIVETNDATTAQQLTFRVQNHRAARDKKSEVHVWATEIAAGTPTSFERIQTIQPRNGEFSLTAEPGYAYSLTTTEGQAKGKAATTAPPSRPMALPYVEEFDQYRTGETPRLFNDLGGAFETAACADRAGMCLEQQLTQGTVQWQPLNDFPLTRIGDPVNWTDYKAEIDTRLPNQGTVAIAARALPPQVAFYPGLASGLQGYHLQVGADGKWALLSQTSPRVLGSVQNTVLASGTDLSLQAGTWHRLGISVEGSTISVFLDGHELASVLDTKWTVGQVGLSASPWEQVQFDNLSILPVN